MHAKNSGGGDGGTTGDSEDLSRGGREGGKREKDKHSDLPVIFLFGDRINILLS